MKDSDVTAQTLTFDDVVSAAAARAGLTETRAAAALTGALGLLDRHAITKRRGVIHRRR